MSDSEKPKSWKEVRQSIKHKWLVLFIFPEWLCEWFSYFLGRWAPIDILGYAGHFAILVALILYFWGCPERHRQAEDQRKAKHYQAWQVITVSQGTRGGGGRKDALEDLNKDDVSLAGVDISEAYLPKLNLPGAQLADANLARVDLRHANLTGADLQHANLARAYLQGARLAEADLTYANLTEATLWDANLAEADLTGANLAGAHVRNANLARVHLGRVNLKNINFWRDITSIEQAKIYDVQNPPEGFIEWATAPKQGAVLIKDKEEWRKLLAEKREGQTQEK